MALFTLIWKPHCKQATSWEKANHITKDVKEICDKNGRQQRKDDPALQVKANAFLISMQHNIDSATETDLWPRVWTSEHNLGN